MKKGAVIFSSILFTGICISCNAPKTDKSTVPVVKTDTVRMYGDVLTESFPGKIKAAADVNLAFRVSGTILRVPVDAGTYVKKGQLLAEIDPRDYEIQLSATEAEYKQVKGEAERVIALYRKNSVAPNDYEKALYGLQQITAKYDSHKNALADTRLCAPFDGYVQKRLFDANETVSAGMPVISMINTDAPEVEVNIPSANYVRQERFGSFFCTVDIFKGQHFPLELVGITRKANLNQLYTMRLRMKDVSGEPMPTPGMATTVTIKYRPEQSVLTLIPLSAVFGQGDESFVWIYGEDSKVVAKRKIKPLEIRPDGSVIVSEGLTAGEKIVAAGVHSLSEGVKVETLPPVSATNIGGLL